MNSGVVLIVGLNVCLCVGCVRRLNPERAIEACCLAVDRIQRAFHWDTCVLGLVYG